MSLLRNRKQASRNQSLSFCSFCSTIWLLSAQLIVCLGLQFPVVVPAVAQNESNKNDSIRDNGDFGAETTAKEPDPTEIALPVELVEEKSDESPPDKASNGEKPKAAAQEKSENPETTPSNTEEGAPLISNSEMTNALNLEDADIDKLVKAMSKLTRRNYIVDSAVKGKVTVHLPTSVTVEEGLRIFDAVLFSKGFTTVPMGNNVWKVLPAKDAQKSTIPLLFKSPDNPSDALVTQLIRLKYVAAADMQKLLSQFISKEGVINAYSGTNSLIFIDSAANIERLKELTELLDVPARDQDITIVPILHAEAKDIADKVNEILGEKEEGVQQSPRVNQTRDFPIRPRTGNNVGGVTPVSAEGTAIDSRVLPLKIIPDERTNSIIVVADEELTQKVRAIVEQLDSPNDLSGGRFYVYRLKYADSEELADIISSIISGSSSGSSSGKKEGTKTTGSSLSRSLTGESSRDSAESRMSSAERTANSSRRTSPTAMFDSRTGEGGGKVNFEGEVSVAADAATNSLVINASRTDYMKVKQLIDELDVKRRQVLVEATILEVGLNNDQGLGIELQGTAGTDSGGVLAQTSFGALSNLIANPTALSDLTIAAASTGTITLPGGIVLPSQAFLLTAVSQNSNVNVLSSPTIVTTDNEEAEIIVGENVPFVTSTSTDPSNLGNTFNQVERQDVGITLRITPQISTGDFVTLRIFVEISNVVPTTRNSPNGPTTTIRTTETTVAVKSNQMIVTGGLISDNVTESSRGVPFLKDIPVLGNLFKRDDNSQRRNNLLVFITPRILRDQFDARESTLKYRDQLEQEMTDREITPDRHEVLQSRDLDVVAEALPQGSTLPSSITSPQVISSTAKPTSPDEFAAIDRTNARIQAMARAMQGENSNNTEQGSTKQKITGQDSDVIDITVKPKLPGSASNEQPMRNSAPQSTAPLSKATSATTNKASASSHSYVVLREMSRPPEGDSAAGLKAQGQLGTVGLAVMSSQNAGSSTFFEVGKRYNYQTPQGKRDFVCLGVYPSLDQAAGHHPVLSRKDSWNEMSLNDLLTLGSGPWTRASNTVSSNNSKKKSLS